MNDNGILAMIKEKYFVYSQKQILNVETCLNPWNSECLNKDIALYLSYKDERLPICHYCWNKISLNNKSWSC